RSTAATATSSSPHSAGREPALQARRGGGGIVGFGDRPDDDDPPRPRVEYLAEARLVDAADREPRSPRPQVGHVADECGPGRLPARLGRRGPAGPGAEVVHARLRSGRPGLVDRVGRTADYRRLAENPPGGGYRQIVLAEV